MSPLRTLVVLLLALALSGCFGYDEDTTSAASTVVIQYEVTELDGDSLAGPTQSPPFRIGSGESGLGADFERQLTGRAINATFEVTLEPAGVAEEHRVDSFLPDEPADRVFTLAEIEAGAGIGPENITVGTVIPNVGLGSGLEVVALEGENATLRYVIRDDQDGHLVEPVPPLALDVHYWIEDGRLLTQMRPREGDILVLPVLDALGRPINPFGVPSGIYRMGALEGEQFVMYGGDLRAIVTEPVVVSGQVLDVRSATATPGTGTGTGTSGEGTHFGSRVSPVRG